MPRLKHIDKNYRKNPKRRCDTSLWNTCPICWPKQLAEIKVGMWNAFNNLSLEAQREIMADVEKEMRKDPIYQYYQKQKRKLF